MGKIAVILTCICAWSYSTSASPPIKNLEISFDTYYAKLKVKKSKVEFEDPYTNESIALKKCNRRAWNNLVASLSTETKDYELLLNTVPVSKSEGDVILKRDDIVMDVTKTSSLGHWTRNIEAHWKSLVSESKVRCKK